MCVGGLFSQFLLFIYFLAHTDILFYADNFAEIYLDHFQNIHSHRDSMCHTFLHLLYYFHDLYSCFNVPDHVIVPVYSMGRLTDIDILL